MHILKYNDLHGFAVHVAAEHIAAVTTDGQFAKIILVSGVTLDVNETVEAVGKEWKQVVTPPIQFRQPRSLG